ncbi:MAG TPA: bifunctional phosphoribosyl-AMP cyclohydrolase/phosphoribosyl-ATP diphosphatase HisIE [Thermoanaerobaculia bacterium]|nr:bifunctional phosphoribosyl-AMP cyclohydrolase/phosphoribosyl-ATP diphosphatase HisIE [Thermoanaerobaculia bacterium]
MSRALPRSGELLPGLRFDGEGLIPVVARDEITGQVLMLAWANREAVERTLETGEAHFWSRSRGELWRKGATSGNVLRVVGVETDCDGDALLLDVHPDGPACHTGATSCFGAGRGGLDLGALERIVAERRDADPAASYTARLFHEGKGRQAQKVGEEATEVVVAALGGGGAAGRRRLVEETADLLYHLSVLLASCGVEAREVAAELGARHRAKRGGDPGDER